jgi:hypothetical protein
MRLWLTLASAGILAASAAQAQDVVPPRIEFGGSFSGLLGISPEDGVAAGAGGGPRLNVNITRGIGIDLMAELVGPAESSGLLGLYATQIRMRIRKSQGGARTLALTAGAAGGFSHQSFNETRRTRPDGSIVVHPAYRRLRVQGPVNVMAGIERQQAVGRHASAAFAVQGLIGPFAGIGLRGAITVSYGVGGSR